MREGPQEYSEMNDTPQQQDWRLLAEQAAEEKDPAKLMEIIRALTSLLDEDQARKQHPRDT